MFESTILFVRKKEPGFGGMESHQIAFMKNCNLVASLDNSFSIFDKDSSCSFSTLDSFVVFLKEVVALKNIKYFFFNDLGFVDYILLLKINFYSIRFILRSGGNDVFRAPIVKDTLPLSIRQLLVRNIINSYIDWIIINSDYSYQRNIDFWISPYKMKKIRGGVDSYLVKSILEEQKVNKILFRNNNCIGDKIVLIFSCRMKKFKGLIEFLEAFSFYRRRESFFLVFIGDGDEKKKIETFIHNSDLCNYSLFLGELSYEDSLKYISLGDYFMNTSIEEIRYYGKESYVHTETMGRSMMEAISLQIPVIATNVGGTKELFYESNYSIGYLIEDMANLANVLDRLLMQNKHNSYSIFKDYSWNSVFNNYSLLMNKPNKHVLVLDLDGTLINSRVELSAIRSIIEEYHNLFYLIINTARFYDEETQYICEYLKADIVICLNGYQIISEHKSRWNDDDFIHNKVCACINDVEEILRDYFKHCEIKKTHPHILQIRNYGIFSSKDIDFLDKVLKDADLDSICNDNLVKIFSKRLTKKAALDFVLKDLYYDKVLGAGDSLNDCLFMESVDYAWVADSMRHVKIKCHNINYFSQNEIGEILLTSIINHIKQLL